MADKKYIRMKKWMRYAVPVLLSLLVGFVASLFQRTALVEWYPGLVKSSLTPPAVVFPIVWTVLYVLMGISLGRIWGRGSRSAVRDWIAQLVLNFSWCVVFFYFREMLGGVIVILLLDVIVLDYIVLTSKRDKWAMWCFVPYLVWLLLASYLNVFIYLNNF